ncbi:2Fe-2S iron-sulfur cluster-binding protein [Bradyrhizobium sp. HKCCYLS1011]|uniref:2Fe-2S iron-sulfur cluster-binding protein n=1 Tax=Bradyrhizobium sp. HKCCYLS1011 TaxID=3420733 RepID=UPI003EBCDBE6
MSGFGSHFQCRRGLCVFALLMGALAANAALASDVRFDAKHSARRADGGWQSAQAEEGHSAHHPGASGAGSDTLSQADGARGHAADVPSSGDATDMMGGMSEMMGRPRKEFYPLLMDMPALSAEQRKNLEFRARGWINGEVDRISESEMNLRHAIAAGDVVGADQVAGRIRDSLNGVQSGFTVLRSLNEGKSPQQIAQSWLKAQMNLPPQPAVVDTDGILGISWFHVTTMALLAIFSLGMLAIQVARMRRASALVDRLTRGPVPVSPASVPAIEIPGASGAGRHPDARAGVAPARQTAEVRSPEPSPHREPAKAGGLWKGKLRVSAIYRETPNIKTFRLQAPDGGSIPFSFLPGQFLTYAIEIDGRVVRRSYTIASSAAQTAFVETTIKREDGGLLSDYMHGNVKTGDLLEVMAPSGAFTFTGVEADSVVLIGGGVGITPLMAAIRYLSDIAWSGQIYLIYGAQTTEQFIFRDELEYLQRRMNNLHVAATMARASGTSWMGSEGRITADFLRRAVPDRVKRRVHLCGPPGMMEALKTILRELGVPSEQIRTEAFGPARGAVPPPTSIAAAAQTAESAAGGQAAVAIGPATATIRFATSGMVAALPPDRSVLEVAESIGVPIDYSCRAGICGICKTHLLEGRVTMEVQDALTEDDKSGGIILACQAKSVEDLVVEA